jgi:hypothetical protein
MTIDDVINDLAVLLEAVEVAPLSGAVIERYWRRKAPEGLTVYLIPHNSNVTEITIGNAQGGALPMGPSLSNDEFVVDAVIEIPWHDDAADGTKVILAGDQLRSVVENNRSLNCGAKRGTVKAGVIDAVTRPFAQDKTYVGQAFVRTLHYHSR